MKAACPRWSTPEIMPIRSRITFGLAGLARAYLAGLFGWLVLRLSFGEQWWWLFLLNSFAEYLFVPLPAVLPVAVLARRRGLWAGFGACLALWCYLYGALWRPKQLLNQPHDVSLTAMTFNMLGFNQHPEGVVAAIRASEADVIALQELNRPAADAIRRELSDTYPYQALDARHGVTGMGVISRYPLRAHEVALPGDWVGPPQLLTLDLPGANVTLLHVHTRSTYPGPRDKMHRTIRERERQAQMIVDFAVAHTEPLIVLGDFNTGDQSPAYATIAGTLTDAWRAAGWGPGHTFPGAASPGSSAPTFRGNAILMWLLRIDYIFHSRHWQARSARIGPWDGVSDHRPVIATLVLNGILRLPVDSTASSK
jgi:vancomycin resistance protein VanJ